MPPSFWANPTGAGAPASRAEDFFPHQSARGPWAPGCLADKEWERAQEVACTLWRLRAHGNLRPIDEVLSSSAVGRLMVDTNPFFGAPMLARFSPGPGLMSARLFSARIVKQTSRLVQLSGGEVQNDREGPTRQTWFAAIDAEEGRAVLARWGGR